MLRRKFIAGLGLAALTAAAGLATTDSASAQFRPGQGRPPVDRPGTWAMLGAQKVGFHVDRDVIRVGRQDGKFRAVKLRVLDNDIEMIDLKIIYGNGQVDDFPVRRLIRRNSETRSIDLKGNTRFIKEVQMTYKSRPNFRGRATVEVWGQH